MQPAMDPEQSSQSKLSGFGKRSGYEGLPFGGCMTPKGKSHECVRLLAFAAPRQANVMDDEDAALIHDTGKADQLLSLASRNLHA